MHKIVFFFFRLYECKQVNYPAMKFKVSRYEGNSINPQK